LWEDENFQLKAAHRYTELRSTLFSEDHIYGIIDSIANYLGPAIDRNFGRWPLLGNYIWPNYYVFDTYEEEITYLKSWTAERLTWMDSELLLLNVKDDFIPSKIILKKPYPNPFNPNTNFIIDVLNTSLVKIDIYNLIGKKVRSINKGVLYPGKHKLVWNAENDFGKTVESGIYLYELFIDNTLETGKLLYIK